MIKKFEIGIKLKLLILLMFLATKSYALSPENEKEIYTGCYPSSKQYIGSEKAKDYCLCTIAMLAMKFNDEQIKLLFKSKPEEIMKKTEYASIHCSKNKKAF
jgi:hypothetical protein